MRERRYMPTRPIGPATKNGMRQPQSYIVASPRPRENPNISSAPKEKPAKVPNSRKLPQKPRFASGEYSASSEEHTTELQSLMRISYAVFCLKKKKTIKHTHQLLNDIQQYQY